MSRKSPDPYSDQITEICEHAYPDFWERTSTQRHELRCEAVVWYNAIFNITD